MSNSQELKIEHYILGKTIGVGGFGKVKIARHEFTKNNVAIKIVNKKRMRDKNMGGRIKREIQLLRYFNHPNIIRLYEVLETQTDVFVVMEYAPKGELFELIAEKGKLNEEEAKFFFRQIIAGVEYCHSNLVAHRDLKPENILLDENRTIKVADFGLSNLMKDGKFMKTDCGSPNYAAPEVISKRKYVGTEVDTWSCGVILFALTAGYLPFDEELLQVLFKKIREADYEMPKYFSIELQDLIRRMLQPNPILRLRFHEIKLHPWLRMTCMLYLDPRQIRLYLNPMKINKELFEKLMDMEFNFRELPEQKVKEMIKKRKDYSFVIGYNLMFDEAVKKQVMTAILKKQQYQLSLENKPSETTLSNGKLRAQAKNGVQEGKSSENGKYIIENIKENILDTFVPVRKKTMINLSADYDGWHYGLKYKVPPKILMSYAMETLLELNTTYVNQSSNFKIQCFHHIYKDFTIFTPDHAFKTSNKINMNGAYIHAGMQKPGMGAAPPVVIDKFSKDELVFGIRVFKLSADSKEYVIDIHRTRGHSIVFLDYYQKFVQILHKKLTESGYNECKCSKGEGWKVVEDG